MRAFVIIATFWYLISTAWMVPLIQLITIEDSCLHRCFRRPSTLSPKLPAVQSEAVAGEAAKAGEGAPRRKAGIGEVPKRSKYDGCDDCYSLFARAAREMGPRGTLRDLIFILCPKDEKTHAPAAAEPRAPRIEHQLAIWQ